MSIAEKMAAEGLLTIPEFSAWAGICRVIAYEHAKTGKLKITKIGRRSGIKATDARAWLENLPVAKPGQAA